MILEEKTYLEKIYAGLLGKAIGIVFGAPLESPFWTYYKIKETYGKIDFYVRDYKNFAADDDMNGPLIFIRVIEDYFEKKGIIDPVDFGKMWLNYTSENRGMFWWGGYGISSEHTAFENLKNGIMPPISGSIDKNGKRIAEQIGGQIFVDTWGMVFPGNYIKAAHFASKAASVSHDGEGINGARFISALVSLAFVEKSINNLFLKALEVLPDNSEYYKMAMDIYEKTKKEDNWEKICEYIYQNYYYNPKYPGPVHIIPNSAVVILGLLKGNGSFSKSLEIVVNCGLDTDCNAGNLGSILGVLNGIKGIEEKWRRKINDVFILSSVIGSLNIVDIPSIAKYIAYLGHIVNNNNNKKLKTKNFLFFDFKLPESTHGFRTRGNCHLKNENENLKCIFDLKKNSEIELFYKPFYRKKDFENERYSPMFSPLIYPGNIIESKLKLNVYNGKNAILRLYAKDTDNIYYHSENFAVKNNDYIIVKFQIPNTNGKFIEEVGIKILNKNSETIRGFLLVDYFYAHGKANYYIDFSKQIEELGSITGFTFNKGYWYLEDNSIIGICSDYAMLYTGNINWKNYIFKTKIANLFGKDFGILFRVKGNLNYYYFGFENNQIILKQKIDGEESILKEIKIKEIYHKEYTIEAHVRDNNFHLFLDELKIFDVKNIENNIENGMVGYKIKNGTRIKILSFEFKEV